MVCSGIFKCGLIPLATMIVFTSPFSTVLANEILETYEIYTISDITARFGTEIDISSARRGRFSHDGKHFAISKMFYDEIGYIRIINMNTGDETIIGGKDKYFGPWREPHWSPDSTKIAFVGEKLVGDKVYYSIFIYDIYSGEMEEIPFEYASMGDFICWSPDGKRIAYSHLVEKKSTGIEIYDLESGDIKRITNNYDGHPVWSPDGKYFVYNGYRWPTEETRGPYDTELRIINVETGVDLLIDIDRFPSIRKWSPDGRLLCTTAIFDDKCGIYCYSFKEEDGSIYIEDRRFIHEHSSDIAPGFSWTEDCRYILCYEYIIEGMLIKDVQLIAVPIEEGKEQILIQEGLEGEFVDFGPQIIGNRIYTCIGGLP